MSAAQFDQFVAALHEIVATAPGKTGSETATACKNLLRAPRGLASFDDVLYLGVGAAGRGHRGPWGKRDRWALHRTS